MRLRPHQVEPLDDTGTTVTDGEYAVSVVDGKVTGLTPAAPVTAATVLVPLTTSINGVPELVWDADNQLVMTEVPL